MLQFWTISIDSCINFHYEAYSLTKYKINLKLCFSYFHLVFSVQWKKLELALCSNLNFWSSMKLEFNEKWARSSSIWKIPCLNLLKLETVSVYETQYNEFHPASMKMFHSEATLENKAKNLVSPSLQNQMSRLVLVDWL